MKTRRAIEKAFEKGWGGRHSVKIEDNFVSGMLGRFPLAQTYLFCFARDTRVNMRSSD